MNEKCEWCNSRLREFEGPYCLIGIRCPNGCIIALKIYQYNETDDYKKIKEFLWRKKNGIQKDNERPGYNQEEAGQDFEKTES